jgi:hypothetical protein
LYTAVKNYTNNGTYYVTAANLVSGNSEVVAVTGVNINPSTSTVSALAFAGGSGAFTTVTTAGTITSTGNIVAASTTNSTSSTTGALVVPNNGGLGVTGNAVFGNAVTINSSQTAAQDFKVNGVNSTNLVWARPNATYDAVFVGNTAVSANIVNGAKFSVLSSDSMMLPVGTSSQRPDAIGYTAVAGMFRYNSTSNAIEWYNGTVWQGATTQFTVITASSFNGDGSTVAFTLPSTSTTAATVVAINGVVQIPTSAYSVSGTTLTFTEAPASGDVIDVRILTTTQTVTSLYSATLKAQVNVDDASGITFISGTGQLPVWSMPIGGGLVSLDANISIASANTPTTIDSFSTSTYRSAKYIVQVTNGTKYQTQEVLLVQDGTTPTLVTYGVLQTSGNLGVVNATISGSTVNLQFTAANATNTVRISREYIQL